MNQPTSRRKIISFYLLTVVLSLLAALGLIEIVLRNMEFTNAFGTPTHAHNRWYEKHWAIENELGFRDFPLRARLRLPGPKVYFLGDSFTVGAGVDFEDTFYFQSVWRPKLDYNAFMIGVPATSTPQQLKIIERFNFVTGATARIVVHQYFLNDIVDRVRTPPVTPTPWLDFAARYLESAELLRAYHFNNTYVQKAAAVILGAYRRPEIMKAHLADLARLHQYIRRQGGSVVFLAFPALNADALLPESEDIIGQLRDFFAGTCQPGDLFIDATSSAATLPASERVVSALDSHPSPALHTLVADRVRQALLQIPVGQRRPAPYESCVELRRSRPADGGAGAGPAGGKGAPQRTAAPGQAA